MEIKHFIIGTILVLMATISIGILHNELVDGYSTIGIQKEYLEQGGTFFGQNYNQSSSLKVLADDVYSDLFNRTSLSTTDYFNLMFFDSFNIVIKSFSASFEIFSGMVLSLSSVLHIPKELITLGLIAVMLALTLTVVALVINRDV